MVAERREYKGGAVNTTISGGITSTATTITISVSSGWPTGSTGPFTVVIDKSLSTEEKVKCLSRSGNTLTVSARGADDTTAVAHANGATIRHALGAYDVDLVNAHAADVTRDDHTQYVHNSTARTISAAHTFTGAPVFSGAPNFSGAPTFGGNPVFSGTPNFSGTPTFASGSYGLVGDISTVNATKAAGTSPKFARADHRHDIDAAAVKAVALPTGVILMWGLDAAIPTNYLELAGGSFSGTTYPELAVLYPSLTLPDMRTRVPRGVASGATGTTGGADTVTLITANLPIHSHTINHGHGTSDPGHAHTGPGGFQYIVGSTPGSTIYTNSGSNVDHSPAWNLTASAMPSATTGLTVNDYSGSSGSAGSGTAVDIVPKWIGVRYIIKAA